MATLVKFQPFTSTIDVPFWFEFTRKKLDELRLSEEAVGVHSFVGTGHQGDVKSAVNYSMDSFSPSFSPPPQHFALSGSLTNFNTIESFKKADKKALLSSGAQLIWADIKSRAAFKNPALLSPSTMITYSDLKKYHFYSWVCYPSLVAKENSYNTVLSEPVSFGTAFGSSYEGIEAEIKKVYEKASSMFHLLLKEGETGDSFSLKSFSEFESLPQTSYSNATLVFLDPSNRDTSLGWPLRNALALLNDVGFTEIKVLSWKQSRGGLKQGTGLLHHIKLADFSLQGEDPVKGTGWELNSKGKATPKFVNLAASMDATLLADSAVDLNLKLMRWRMLPKLDLEGIAKTRCLLLGAGTLGCNIARSLLGWGVRNMTFVDSGKVSYSNPVRQTLFTFEDSKKGTKKAVAAAAALKSILPSVNAQSVVMTIPMPGHPVQTKDEEEVAANIKRLSDLIDGHDVVYFCLDSREARWLPTLLCSEKGKLALNVALGFDSFVVMRHGIHDYSEEGSGEDEKEELGCYFCNDVMAPDDSVTNRTLDQQCTVTRPGLSFLSSSLAVELMVSLLQHPLGGRAPADLAQDIGTTTTTDLGLLPHQVRGFLTTFSNLIITGKQYNRCVACSPPVVQAFRKSGNSFLFEVFNKPSTLEDTTGITAMKAETVDMDTAWGSDDDFDM